MEQVAFLTKAGRGKKFQIKKAIPSMGMILMFPESLGSELSKNVYFYHSVIYSFCFMVLSLKSCRDTQKKAVPPPLKYCYKLCIQRQNGGDSYFLFHALPVFFIKYCHKLCIQRQMVVQ